MLNVLEVPPYMEGYNYQLMACLDLAIAAASGYYNYDNYYYYSFYYTFFSNWTTVDSWTWDIRNHALNKIGLNLNPYRVDTPDELLSLIKSNIDNHKPLLLVVPYYSLFYHQSYLVENTINDTHFCLITGYDSERKVIILKAYSHQDQDITISSMRPFMRGDAFHNFSITENMLCDIWKISNDVFQFQEENAIHHNTLYVLEKSGSSVIHEYPYIDLLRDLLDNYDFSHCKLFEFYSGDHDKLCNLLKDNARSAHSFMRRYSGGMFVIFDVLEKTFKFMAVDAAFKQEVYNFRDKYFDFRKFMVSKLMANIGRGKRLTESEKNDLFDEIRKMNDELFSLISNIYIEFTAKKNY